MGKLNGNGWAYIANTNRKDYMGNVMVNFSKDFCKHHIQDLTRDTRGTLRYGDNLYLYHHKVHELAWL